MVDTLQHPGDVSHDGKIVNEYQTLGQEPAPGEIPPSLDVQRHEAKVVAAQARRVAEEVPALASAEAHEHGMMERVRHIGEALESHLDRHRAEYTLGAKAALLIAAEAVGMPGISMVAEATELGYKAWASTRGAKL